MHRLITSVAHSALVFVLVACGNAEARQSQARRDAEIQRLRALPGYVVDTVHDAEEMIRRFREGVTPPPKMSLTNAAGSRDELVHRFLDAVSSADTLALQTMRLDSAEFAWIYFPGSPYSQPPYELPPDYVWFHTMAESRKGAQRAMRLLKDNPIQYSGYACAEEPERYGEARLWTSCQIRWRDHQGRDWTLRLFGSIIEHRELFKFVSYANKL